VQKFVNILCLAKFSLNSFWHYAIMSEQFFSHQAFLTPCLMLYLCRYCCNCSYVQKKSQIVHSRTFLVYYFLQNLALKDFAVLHSCLEMQTLLIQNLARHSVVTNLC